jgi:hypothetical protein
LFKGLGFGGLKRFEEFERFQVSLFHCFRFQVSGFKIRHGHQGYKEFCYAYLLFTFIHLPAGSRYFSECFVKVTNFTANIMHSAYKPVMNKQIFFLFCCLALNQTLQAQYRSNVHSISRREGLSNGAVNTIAKDAEGYIWFGTWNGLNRYEGSSIVTFLPGLKPFAVHNHVNFAV